jgi:FkbM family methyltransferase
VNSYAPSYSQFREDRLLDGIFAGRSGTCVEVGANDGVTGSTTYYFEKMGWKCVLVEPVPELCDRIRRSRSALLFECAASSEAGEDLFYVAETEPSLSSSSIVAPPRDGPGGGRAGVRAIRVRKRTLDEILIEAGISRPDFVTIDVEGHELEVLQGFSVERFRPDIIIVEDNSERGEPRVKAFLKERGYEPFFRTGVNDWYAPAGDVVTGPASIERLRMAKNRCDFEDAIARRLSFLSAVAPESVKSALRMALRALSGWVKRH